MDIKTGTEVYAESRQSITVGELRELLAALPDETPVISYGIVKEDGEEIEDYINLTSVQVQGYDEGSPILVMDQGGATDNRGW